jgi:hypothetical protein
VKVCTAEILRFLHLLAEPCQIVELRLLKVQARGARVPVTMSGYFDSYQQLAAAAQKYGDAARGVYVTLNPLNPALLARAANRLRAVGKDDPLTTDADILTAVANDFSFERIFVRQLEGCAGEGDVAWGLSTSGHSANVVAGLKPVKQAYETAYPQLQEAAHALLTPQVRQVSLAETPNRTECYGPGVTSVQVNRLRWQ